MNSYWVKESGASFYLRQDDPIIIVDSIFVDEKLGISRSIGKTLLDLTGEVANSLGCEDRIYAQSVTNPEFWRREGYEPVSFFGNKMYWSKTKLSD